MKTFKVDESNNRVKESFNSPRIINLGELTKHASIEDVLAREVFIPLANKHGITEQAVSNMHPVEHLRLNEIASPAERLDFIIDCASRDEEF